MLIKEVDNLITQEEKIIQILNQKGYVLTSQRKIILNLLLVSKEHLTIKNICNLVNDPNMGQATIYRTIKLFLELGILRKVNFGDNDFYELSLSNKHNHHHLVCSKCGKIIGVDFDYLEELEKKIYDEYGFIVENHTLKFCGICKECEIKRRDDAAAKKK
jgi:Fur family ferric uptake transcriptional regulator